MAANSRSNLKSNPRLSREDDPGFAYSLAQKARVAVFQQDDGWVVQRSGRVIHSSGTVRGIVSYLRGLLDSNQEG